MEFLSGAFLHLQYIFLMQFLLTLDESPLWSLPPSPIHLLFKTDEETNDYKRDLLMLLNFCTFKEHMAR